MATATPLLPLVRKFFETDAVTAARTLDGMDHQDALAVLKALPPTLAAQVVRHLLHRKRQHYCRTRRRIFSRRLSID